MCRYCGNSFCAEHHLPETHNCQLIGARVIPMKTSVSDASSTFYAKPKRFRTSRTELLHLTIGVGVLVIIETPGFFRYGVNILFRIAGVITLAFILHELAHKLMAQHYGLWSEFRLNPFGALLSLLTLFSPIKIIAPGAVVIFGSRGTGEKWGKIALAGPLVNIIQLVVFTILSPFYPVLGYAAFLNAELAVFNLLPFSVLDGRKVFNWNKRVWVVVFATAFILGAFLRIRL